MKYLGQSIKAKLLIPFFLAAFLFLASSQIAVFIRLSSILSQSLDQDLTQTTDALHQVMEISFRESIISHIKGITWQNIQILKGLQSQVDRGLLEPEEAKKLGGDILLFQQIGNDGYSYVADSSGIIQVHPNEELIGESSIFAATFLNRDEQVEEYVEYEFQGRLKVLYREYYEPWDWIVAATAYRQEFHSLLDLEKHNDSLASSFDKGYSFIMDMDGQFLVHPENHGEMAGENFQQILHEIEMGKHRGIMEWEDQGEPYRIFYKKVDDFQWILGSVYSLSHIYSPVSHIILIVAVLNTISFIVLFLILSAMVQRMVIPLKRLTLKMLDQEDGELDELSHMGDEIQVLENVFDLYLQRLHVEQQRTARANEENRILARFPHELQFPLIRIDWAGAVLFMNEAARESKSLFLQSDISKLPEELLKDILPLQEKGGDFDIVIQGTSYQVVVTPIQKSQELYLHFHDKTMARQYQTLQSIWDNVFEATQEGFALTDENGIIEDVNSSFTRITGFSKEEVLGLHTRLLRSDRHDRQFFEKMWAQIEDKGHWQGEIWNRKKNGDVYLEWLSISSFVNRYTGKNQYMAIFHDISEIRQKEEELAHIIHHDILTDLPNRNSFYEQLSVFLDRRSDRQYLAVVILDLDNFTMIYNYLGASLGDDFLQYMAGLFQSVIRGGDIVARLGSAEFAICLNGLEEPGHCHQLINRLQEKLDRTIELGGHSLTPFVNMGISICPRDGDTPEILIRRARLAMQQGRQVRKGSHLFFEEDMEKNQLDRFDAHISLRAALKNHEFMMVYQPQSNFHDGNVMGFEALIRWNRPEKGMVPPQTFIPVLEENGMILEVGEWIIAQVCQFINELRGKTEKSFRVSINISARQFASANFMNRLVEICNEHDVPSSFIDLEITENIAALDLEGVVETLDALRGEGFSISIDDFGTGYSSLSYLKELPFDILKIDRSFISPIEEKGASLAIVRSVVALAKSLGKLTVAEGVETKGQSRICRQEGCNILQGYLLSKPMSSEDCINFFINSFEKGD